MVAKKLGAIGPLSNADVSRERAIVWKVMHDPRIGE
jgi:hypothetical protein